jgi:hypothetical protein
MEAGMTYFEKLAAVKSPQTFMEVTTEYTKSAYETFGSETTKIGDLYREAFKPVAAKIWAIIKGERQTRRSWRVCRCRAFVMVTWAPSFIQRWEESFDHGIETQLTVTYAQNATGSLSRRFRRDWLFMGPAKTILSPDRKIPE